MLQRTGFRSHEIVLKNRPGKGPAEAKDLNKWLIQVVREMTVAQGTDFDKKGSGKKDPSLFSFYRV
jgi:hypothetical protein